MEALGRAALFKYEADKVCSVERKVHEIFQLMRASLGKTGKGRRPTAPPGYGMLLGEALRPPDGVYTSVHEVFEPRMVLTTSQQQYEARVNAERKQAVDMMINKEKYEAMAAAKEAGGKGGKGGDKGGKKKK